MIPESSAAPFTRCTRCRRPLSKFLPSNKSLLLASHSITPSHLLHPRDHLASLSFCRVPLSLPMAAERVVLALTCIVILCSACDGQIVGSCGADKSREFDKCSLVPLSFGGANLTFTASAAEASSYCKSVCPLCVPSAIPISFLVSLIKLINFPALLSATTVLHRCLSPACNHMSHALFCPPALLPKELEGCRRMHQVLC